jgi:hypothetical protein
VGGDVYYDIWDEPRPGQKVGLTLDDLGNLIVYHNPDRGDSRQCRYGEDQAPSAIVTIKWR